jgi:hypothetical protein
MNGSLGALVHVESRVAAPRSRGWECRLMFAFSLCRLAVLIAIPLTLGAQGNNNQSATKDKRIFWIFPNYRTEEESAKVPPLTPRGKFAIAWHDSTDPGIFVHSALIAGISQATNGNPSFGQGTEGYVKRYAATYADFAIQNVWTEGIFPTLLHQDPRYFRRGKGSVGSRMRYAITRLFITRTDSGKHQFNYSEVVGAAVSVGISNAYYSDGRNVEDNLGRYGIQFAFDGGSNILKEFWPDIKRKLPRRLVPH